MYFSNSQASRDLPMPATPTTETSWAVRSSATAWKSSLTRRSSRSRPTNGASRPVDAAAAAALRRRRAAPARAGPARLALELVLARVLVGDRRLRRALGRLADEHVPGSAARLDPRRGVDEVARDHALTLGAERHRRLAGEHAGAGAQRRCADLVPSAATASTRSSAARTARSASSSCATGAPHTAITASPMNFSTVPP